jgi:hypothetical protein
MAKEKITPMQSAQGKLLKLADEIYTDYQKDRSNLPRLKSIYEDLIRLAAKC